MKCKACNALIEKEIFDKEINDYSDLCPSCYMVSELARHNEFVGFVEYEQDTDTLLTKLIKS